MQHLHVAIAPRGLVGKSLVNHNRHKIKDDIFEMWTAIYKCTFKICLLNIWLKYTIWIICKFITSNLQILMVFTGLMWRRFHPFCVIVSWGLLRLIGAQKWLCTCFKQREPGSLSYRFHHLILHTKFVEELTRIFYCAIWVRYYFELGYLNPWYLCGRPHFVLQS